MSSVSALFFRLPLIVFENP